MTEAERFAAEGATAYRQRVGKKGVAGSLWARRGTHVDGVGSYFYPNPAVALTWSGDVGSYITWAMSQDAARALAQQLLAAVGGPDVLNPVTAKLRALLKGESTTAPVIGENGLPHHVEDGPEGQRCLDDCPACHTN